MVSLKDVQSSNTRIAATLPRGLVSVFVGATSGIGETTLKQFAKHTSKPRVYFIGRSQEAGDRIAAECQALNAEGEYIFIKADTSLICSVDEVCTDIKSKEKSINLLFLTTYSLIIDLETSEGLPYGLALAIYCRSRFILNLLPLLENATALRRVVSVLGGTREGPINIARLQGRESASLRAHSGHGASVVTLSLEALAQRAPSVSFIHDFPGLVKSGIARGTTGILHIIMKIVFALAPILAVPNIEAGERHLFLATSARYPAGTLVDANSGVPLDGEVAIARGTSGKVGSGVYSVDSQGESAGPAVEKLLAQFRTQGLVEKVWDHIEGEFSRITEPNTK